MIEAATVHAAFMATAARFAERPFLAMLDETARVYATDAGEITYAAMTREVSVLRDAYAAAGFGSGDRVGLLLENRPVFFRHWLALNALGVSVVPINPDLRSGEIEYLVAHSELVAAVVLPQRQADVVAAAKVGDRTVSVFGPDDSIPALRANAPTAASPTADTECALLYTSGTTGRPKGCILTNTYYLNSGRWYLATGGLMHIHEGAERMLTPLPLFHMNAMATSTMTMILSGGCLVVLDRFHPKTWWHTVRAAGATIVHYLGVMPPLLMGAPPTPDDRHHSVRFGFGAGVDRRLHAGFEERFGFPLIEAWAMTETGGGVVIAAANEPRLVGSNCFGRVGPEAETRVAGDDGTDVAPDTPGELLVRRAGPDPRHGFFQEYLKDAAATDEAWAGGWFHTGDIVRRDADGNFHFVDRKKNVIRRSGENISAVEVESVLQQHPDVAAVAVGAAPDDLRGDEVFACVVLRAPPVDDAHGQMQAVALQNHCLARLAYYKAPGYIAFVDTLPLTATQKIQRGVMTERIAELVTSGRAIDLRPFKTRRR